MWDQITPVKFSKSMWHHCQFSGKEGSIQTDYSEAWTHECRGHERSPRSKKDTPAKLCGLYWSSGNVGAHFKIARGKRIRDGFQSFDVHAEQKDLSSEELETLRRSRTHTVVVTANGEVQTNAEVQMHVHDLDLFVTVQLPEDTPTVV